MFPFLLVETTERGERIERRRVLADSLTAAREYFADATFGRPRLSVESEASFNLGIPKPIGPPAEFSNRRESMKSRAPYFRDYRAKQRARGQ